MWRRVGGRLVPHYEKYHGAFIVRVPSPQYDLIWLLDPELKVPRSVETSENTRPTEQLHIQKKRIPCLSVYDVQLGEIYDWWEWLKNCSARWLSWKFSKSKFFQGCSRWYWMADGVTYIWGLFLCWNRKTWDTHDRMERSKQTVT
jgi:hypothetical protein